VDEDLSCLPKLIAGVRNVLRRLASLFQSKNEPEGSEGQANWKRFLSGLELSQIRAVVGAEEMWKSVLSISKVFGKAVGGFSP
jgi:hypothetical protein